MKFRDIARMGPPPPSMWTRLRPGEPPRQKTGPMSSRAREILERTRAARAGKKAR